MRRLLQVSALVTVIVLAVIFTVNGAAAAPLKVRVRGAAKISARGWREQIGAGNVELVLSGVLDDDAGEAMPNTSVTVRVVRETDAHDPRVAQGLRTAHTCSRTSSAVRVAGTRDLPEIVATTDEGGRFCFRALLDPDRYVATVTYAPPSAGPHALAGFIDGVEKQIHVDLSRRGLALRFDPVPQVLSIDAPRVALEAVALHGDDDTPAVAIGLPITLANEQGDLETATTDISGRAHFAIAGTKLGPPGRGELRATFAGNADIAGTTATEDVERHVKVQLKVKGELSAMVPEDGIPLAVDVSSIVGPVAEGSVEAWIGDVIVGAAPVEKGTARVTLTFASSSNEALVRLRYVPPAPWFEPVGEPTVKIPIRGPSLWSKAPLLLAGLAVVAFFLVGRVSAPKAKAEPAAPKDLAVPDAQPKLEVVRAAARGEEGWSGRITDAHEGAPIAGARVSIDRGTFEGRTRLVQVETGRDGRFTLPGIGPVAGDETIHAEARLHARLSQPLPAPGEIAIALVQRRRALLASLVAWAKRRGTPFDVRPEPTPGFVRRVAENEVSDPATAAWAAAVESAVFGPGEVDQRREEAVERLAPDKPAK